MFQTKTSTEEGFKKDHKKSQLAYIGKNRKKKKKQNQTKYAGSQPAGPS